MDSVAQRQRRRGEGRSTKRMKKKRRGKGWVVVHGVYWGVGVREGYVMLPLAASTVVGV